MSGVSCSARQRCSGGRLGGAVSVPNTRWRKGTWLTRRAHPSVKEGAGPACQREKGEEGRGGTVGWATAGPSEGGKEGAGHGPSKPMRERERPGWAAGSRSGRAGQI